MSGKLAQRLAAIHIHDPHDPRLEDYRDILALDARERATAGQRDRRDVRKGLFIGEQFLIVEKMLAVPGLTKSILIAPNHLERFRERYDVVEPGADDAAIPLYVAPAAVIEAVAGFAVHRGALAVGRRPDASALSIDRAVPHRAGNAPLTVLLCEEIRNIDNIGMLFRNAAAFGVDAVVLSGGCHDPLYRKSLRVSIGHALSIPWARTASWFDDLTRLKREWELTLIAASTAAESMAMDHIERPLRVGIVVGSEFEGLSAAALSLCDHVARIPMARGVDSLNVATAAAILLHRFSRSLRV